MDPQGLQRAAAEGQQQVGEALEHQRLCQEAADQRRELVHRLNNVKTSFINLFVDLDPHSPGRTTEELWLTPDSPFAPSAYSFLHTLVVTLGRVEPGQDAEGNDQPGGLLNVDISRVRGGNDVSDRFALNIVGYKLSFWFSPELEPEVVEGEPSVGHRFDICQESTVWQKTDSRWPADNTSLFDVGATGVRPKEYLENYLPQRQQEVSNLESSLQLIHAALEDPELNPWVEQRRKANQERYAAEAAANERDRQERLADQPAAEAVAVETTPQRPRRGLFGRG